MQSEEIMRPRAGSKIKKTAGSSSSAEANDAGAQGMSEVTRCDKECLKMQTEAAHKHMGLNVGEGESDKLMLRADSSGKGAPPGFVPGGAVSSPPPFP
jgi:hypothetical protein